MYSIVMLAAMTAAPETPEFGGLFGHGHKQSYSCNGCTGYAPSYGCGGGYAQTTWGGGCCGGGGHSFLGLRSMFHGHKSGCCGGGYAQSNYTWGGGCCGGYGHGYAEHAIPTYYYQGGGCTGCTGYVPYGGGYGVPQSIGGVAVPAGHEHYPAVPGTAVPLTPAIPVVPVVPVVPVKPTAAEAPEAVGSVPATRAQVVVTVPANAKLYADGRPTALTGASRNFLTPELTAGRDFQYTLQIEYTVDGQTQSAAKQVVVRAGHRTTVDLTAADAVTTTSPVTATLPENAKLFVEEKAVANVGGRMTFRTPELTQGQTYAYLFRAEVVRDGKTDVQTQRVVFKAGEPISVDFSDMTAVRTAAK